MRLELGYPHPRAERQMFQRKHTSGSERVVLKQRISNEQLQLIRTQAGAVHASDNLLDYLQRLVAYTRSSAEFAVGLSPRGALALLDCARTWALMHNRGHLVPEDLQMVLPAVAAHRLVPAGDYAGDGMALVELLRREVDVIRA
jgi:MoxR-like ATPase